MVPSFSHSLVQEEFGCLFLRRIRLRFSSDAEHAVLGIVGKHAQTLPGLPLSTFLLGLRDGNAAGAVVLGLTAGSMGQRGIHSSPTWSRLLR